MDLRGTLRLAFEADDGVENGRGRDSRLNHDCGCAESWSITKNCCRVVSTAGDGVLAESRR